MKLSLRDKKAGGADTWDVENGIVNQNRETRETRMPSFEYQQKALNKIKQQKEQGPPPTASAPVTKQNADGTWLVVKDGVKYLFDKTKKNLLKKWQSESQPVMASIQERKKRIEAAVNKSSK